MRKILGYYKNEKSNIVIAGGGTDGYNLAKILTDSSFNFHIKIIEPDIDRCRWLAEKFDNIMILNLSALDKQGLLDEGIEYADIFVALNEDVASNVSSCFLVSNQPLRQLICAVEDPSYQSIFNFFSQIDIHLFARMYSLHGLVLVVTVIPYLNFTNT